MSSLALSKGQAVELLSGRRGTVIEPPGGDILPKHALVLFPSGDRMWVLAEVVILNSQVNLNETSKNGIDS